MSNFWEFIEFNLNFGLVKIDQNCNLANLHQQKRTGRRGDGALLRLEDRLAGLPRGVVGRHERRLRVRGHGLEGLRGKVSRKIGKTYSKLMKTSKKSEKIATTLTRFSLTI